MITVYTNYYFLPVINETNIDDEAQYREYMNEESNVNIKTETPDTQQITDNMEDMQEDEDYYGKLFEEIDNEFIEQSTETAM